MKIISGIMRSNLLDKDFELLLSSTILSDIIDDGFATELDNQLGLFSQKKLRLTTRFEDFLKCNKFLDNSDLKFRNGINRHWGTTERLHEIVEKQIDKTISHGALLLALDLRGMELERIDDRKDAFMSISDRTKF